MFFFSFIRRIYIYIQPYAEIEWLNVPICVVSSMYNYLRLPHVKVNRASGGLPGARVPLAKDLLLTICQRIVPSVRLVYLYILGKRLDFCEFHRFFYWLSSLRVAKVYINRNFQYSQGFARRVVVLESYFKWYVRMEPFFLQLMGKYIFKTFLQARIKSQRHKLNCFSG